MFVLDQSAEKLILYQPYYKYLFDALAAVAFQLSLRLVELVHVKAPRYVKSVSRMKRKVLLYALNVQVKLPRYCAIRLANNAGSEFC